MVCSVLSISGGPDLIGELGESLATAGLSPLPQARMRGLPGAAEIAVALGSAGAFTTLYQVVAALLARHKDRELKIERAGCSVCLKGHSLAEEKELLQTLAPELLRSHPVDTQAPAPSS